MLHIAARKMIAHADGGWRGTREEEVKEEERRGAGGGRKKVVVDVAEG